MSDSISTFGIRTADVSASVTLRGTMAADVVRELNIHGWFAKSLRGSPVAAAPARGTKSGCAVRLAAAIALREAGRSQDRRSRASLRRVTARTNVLADIVDWMEAASAASTPTPEILGRCLAKMGASLEDEFGAEFHGISLTPRSLMVTPSEDTMVVALMTTHELVANALRHAFLGTFGGMVEVDASSDGEWLVIRVCDDGCGVEDGAMLGAGGGLCLCEALAERSGGTLTVATREGKGGTEAILRLPL